MLDPPTREGGCTEERGRNPHYLFTWERCSPFGPGIGDDIYERNVLLGFLLEFNLYRFGYMYTKINQYSWIEYPE